MIFVILNLFGEKISQHALIIDEIMLIVRNSISFPH